uniref:Uncharacterized protein n=1 Tax=Oncorhynchus mykiss TaxID=8022 RepID=A0A8K9WQR4_ONCMY
MKDESSTLKRKINKLTLVRWFFQLVLYHISCSRISLALSLMSPVPNPSSFSFFLSLLYFSCLFLALSTLYSLSLSLSLSVYLPFSFCLCLSLSLSLSVSLPFSFCLSLFLCLSVSLPFSVSLSLFLCLSLFLSLSLCLSLSLSLSLSLIPPPLSLSLSLSLTPPPPPPPQENQRLKQELMQSHTNIAFLQSELDSLKSDLTDHSINSEGYEAMMREFSDERDNLERQIEILQAANRKLNDSNDGLLSSLENSLSKSNKRDSSASPASIISRRSRSNCYSSPYLDRFYQAGVEDVDEDEDPLGGLFGGGGRGSLGCRRPGLDTIALALCDPGMQRRHSYEVDSLPESCLDSGMSTLRGSNYGYDSEQEVKGHEDEEEGQRVARITDGLAEDNFDNDIAEVRNKMVFGSDNGSVLDWKPLEPVSRNSSGASTRKALSAITNEVQDRGKACGERGRRGEERKGEEKRG